MYFHCSPGLIFYFLHLKKSQLKAMTYEVVCFYLSKIILFQMNTSVKSKYEKQVKAKLLSENDYMWGRLESILLISSLPLSETSGNFLKNELTSRDTIRITEFSL